MSKNVPVNGDGHETENRDCYRHVGDEVVDGAVKLSKYPLPKK